MKRTELKSRPRRLSRAERQEAAEFHAVCEFTFCHVCRLLPATASHHVLYKQHCPPGRKYDPANALPVCGLCHVRHHNRTAPIPADCLTEQNLQFANDVLGPGAGSYINRRYAT